MRPLLFACLLLTSPALAETAMAETPLTGAEFDAYTQGKIMTYGVAGNPYGVEEYLPGRRVVWAYLDDDCRYGTWYEADRSICFVYTYRPLTPICWQFYLRPEGLTGTLLEADGSLTTLVEIKDSAAASPCSGPLVGV